MESSKIVDSTQGCGGSEGKQKTVYQTLQPKVLWKKYPLPYVCLISNMSATSWWLNLPFSVSPPPPSDLIFCPIVLSLLSSLFRDNAENMYFFSSLALTLNEPEEGVAPTDSRLRPDQRLMEEGLWDEANSQKQCLEERQRQERKRREVQTNQALEEGEMKKNNKEEKSVLWLVSVCSSTGQKQSLYSNVEILHYNMSCQCLKKAWFCVIRATDRGLPASVVWEENRWYNRGKHLRLQGRLLGGQRKTGLEPVPRYLPRHNFPLDIRQAGRWHLVYWYTELWTVCLCECGRAKVALTSRISSTRQAPSSTYLLIFSALI